MSDVTTTLRAILVGDSASAEAAMLRTAAAADAAADEMNSKFDKATSDVGGMFSRLGQAGESWGIPFSGSLTKMGERMDEAKSHGQGLSQGITELGRVTTAVAATGIVAIGAASVDLALKWQTTVASIAANGDIPLATARKIGQAFLDTAGTTEYSGQEIGKAYASVVGQLDATQGHALSTKQAMDVMRASMDLATASGTDLGTTTSVMAAVMQAYDIKANGAAAASNILYEASKITGTGISAQASALEKLHSTLGAVAPPLGQVAGLTVDLAQHGETGRKALSAVNTALNGMLAPTAAVANAQQFLGVQVFNAQGKFVGMRDLLGELQPKLAGLSQQQQLATLKAIGMGTGNKALLSTILSGPAAFDKATAAVTRQNAAHDAALAKEQTLSAQVKILSSAISDYGTDLGDALLPKIEMVIHATEDIVTWFMKHKIVAEVLGGVIGGVLAASMVKYAVSVGGDAVRATTNFAKSLLSPIDSLKAAAAGTEETADASAEMQASLDRLDASLKLHADSIARAAEAQMTLAESSADLDGTNLTLSTSTEAVTAAWEAMAAAADEVTAGFELIEGAAPELEATFEETGEASSVALGPIGIALMAIVTVGMLVVSHWKEISRLLLDAWHAVDTGARAVFGAVEQFFKKWGVDLLVAFLPVVGIPLFLATHWHKVESDAKAIWGDVLSFIKSIPGKILSAFAGAASWLDKIGSDILHGLWNGMLAEATLVASIGEKAKHWVVEAVITAGTWLVNIGEDVIRGLIHGVEHMAGAAADAVKKVGHDIVGAAKSILGVFSPSTVFADIGANLMKGLAQGISQNKALAAAELKAMDLANQLVPDLTRIGVAAQQLGQRLAVTSTQFLQLAMVGRLVQSGFTAAVATLQTVRAELTALQAGASEFASSWVADWSSSEESIADFWAATSDVFADMKAQGFDYLTVGMDAFRDEWNSDWQIMRATVASVWSQVQSYFTQIRSTGLDQIRTDTDTLRAQWTTDWQTIGSSTSGVWSQMSGTFSNIKAGLDQLTTSSSSLKSTWSGTWSSMSAAVTGAFPDPSQMLVPIGQDLMSGLANGINAGASAVAAAAANAAQGAVTAAQAQVKAHSPSQVFHDIGGFMMQGLALGITDHASVAEAAVKQVAQKLASVPFTLPTTATAAASAAGGSSNPALVGAAGSQTGGLSAGSFATTTLEVSVNLDSQQLANKTVVPIRTLLLQQKRAIVNVGFE